MALLKIGNIAIIFSQLNIIKYEYALGFIYIPFVTKGFGHLIYLMTIYVVSHIPIF